MASGQHFEGSTATPFGAVKPASEYRDVEGWYGTTPEQEERPLYSDFIGANSPSAAAALWQEHMDIEEQLWSNYLSLVMADASESPVLAGPSPVLATQIPFQDGMSVCRHNSSSNFDYLNGPVYQNEITRAHLEDVATYEGNVALTWRFYPEAHGSTPLPPACIALRDLHKPLPMYMEAPTTFLDDQENWRRAHRRDASSPLPITRRPPAHTRSIVPGFSSFQRRNVQVTTSMPAESAAKPVAPTEVSRSAPKSMDRWKCPHCSFIQWSRRGPDFRRHIATHTGSSAQALYLCCGVPFMEAAEHGVPEDVVREQPVWEFEGLFMVGGCRRTFSRKDAYMRHLHRQAGMCFGDAQASYQPGNRARAA